MVEHKQEQEQEHKQEQDINELRFECAAQAVDNLSVEQQSKFCIIFGKRVLDQYDTREEMDANLHKYSCLDVSKYYPHKS